MAKRKKPDRQGRSGDPRKRAARTRAETTPELEDEVEIALATEHPIDIVTLASSLIAGLETLPEDAADSALPAELPPPAEFVRMFLDSEDPRLQILAWTVAQLLPDARLQAEVRTALTPGTVPAWLASLEAPELVAAWQSLDPLRDSTDVAVSLRVGDADLTIIGLIDLNLGAALKDGFVIPAPLADFQAAFTESGAIGMESVDLSPADARAWLADAIDVGRGMVPPLTSESWPQARPLMEWAIRQCPLGGSGWQPPTWSLAAIEEIVDAFGASAAGRTAVGAPAAREVLVEALRALVTETSADPHLLSGVRLEIGLGYLWATTVHGEFDALLDLPEMLRAYVRWAHSERGIPADDTDAALASIAHYRAGFVAEVTQLHGVGIGDDDLD